MKTIAKYEKIFWQDKTNIKVINFEGDFELDEPVPRHWHRSLEIIVPKEGCAQVWVEGKNKYILPGQILVINSMVIHSAECFRYTKHYRGYAFQISYDYLCKNIPKFDKSILNTNYTKEETNQIIEVLEKIALLKTSPDKYTHYMLEGYSLVLLGLLCSNHLVEKTNKTNIGDHQILTPIIDYLDSNYSQKINVEDLAKDFNISYGHLARLFKKFTGFSIYNYLMEQRLNHCLLDLRYTSKSITQIAYNNGFNDLKSFNQAFKKKFQNTPMNYRKMLENTIKM